MPKSDSLLIVTWILIPEVYRGGYNHTVDAATKAALIAGGVGVTESNFTAL
jgi:hypothetical protein